MTIFDDSQRTKVLSASLLAVLGCLGGWLFFFRSSEAFVSGLVTFDGVTLNAAQVAFISEAEKNPGAILAVTNAEGRYKLVGNASAGVAVGKYRVVVTKTTMSDGSAPSGEDLETAREDGLLKNQLPAIYEDRETTPFRIELFSGGNTINLDVKK